MEKQKQFVLTSHLLAAFVFSLTEGQHTIANVTLEEMFFSSPGYIDELDYGYNMTRDYRFHTNYPGHTLVLQVAEFVLEPGDKNDDCLYDKVLIYDGYNQSAAEMTELCGTIPPGTTYTTSGDTVYVVFTSDGSENFIGFQFSIVSDGPLVTTTTEKSTSAMPMSTAKPTTVSSATLPVSSRTTSIIVSTTTDSTDSSTTSQTSTESPTSRISSATPTSIPTRGTSDMSTVPTSITKPTTTSSTTVPVSTRTTSTLVPTTTSQTLTESPTSISSSTTSISTSTRDSIDTSTVSMSTIKPTTTISTTSPVSTRTTSARIPITTDSSDLSTTSQTLTVSSTSVSSAASTSTTTHAAIETSTSTNTYPETTDRNTTEDDTPTNDYTIWVIVACCAVGFILFVISGVALYRFLKTKENTVKTVYPLPSALSHDTVGKTAFRNEAPVFENGTTRSTNIFEMDLPSPKYKAHTLPPLSDGVSVETV